MGWYAKWNDRRKCCGWLVLKCKRKVLNLVMEGRGTLGNVPRKSAFELSHWVLKDNEYLAEGRGGRERRSKKGKKESHWLSLSSKNDSLRKKRSSSNSIMLTGNAAKTDVSEEAGKLAKCTPDGGGLSIHSYERAAWSQTTFFSQFPLGEVKMMSFRETSLSKETR